MCMFCDPSGWDRACCNICGAGSKVYASISISMPHGNAYPYTQTDLCRKCFDEHGIQAAIEHNNDIREIAGVEQ